MIVAVKRNNKKRVFIKLISALSLVGLLFYYYNHMSEEYKKKEELANEKQLEQIQKDEEAQKSKKLERVIYREIETAVDLIGQRKVINVKIVSNKALIIVDPDTNLEALKIRYGTAALIKKDLKDIKIALDLKYIIENMYNEN